MENWKDIPGFEGRYQVSDLGRVRSLPRLVRSVSKRGLEFERPVGGVILRPGSCRGYLIVNLSGRGTIAVHLLVARAFLPCEELGLQVNHIDGIKAHNQRINLEWVTIKENQDHAVTTGLRKQSMPVKDPATGEVFASKARAIRAHGKQARKWSTT
ncbi:NUMOD4 [uncultured Caudovirales phage]|uniref:NUMOD4 n=1 Tax=uncultured Caudovirales phage TaxID=2100421 RepID=A0A6J7VLV5_9CAUD|nr:NUMOD4 [uncultured Caudovirales phage]